eukprot:TRINITY_DN5068_c0_g1_i1.p1 TRINITY_DN5068_c0_g1~~TRINITY_DN5068_c0_g1_i1.p1  ORF type:complete len:267 (-),score=30.81 TRINITY_DN5068_c0_g1_i1:323-1123(-)
MGNCTSGDDELHKDLQRVKRERNRHRCVSQNQATIEQAERVWGSEMISLTVVRPKQLELHAHAMDTVSAVLAMAAGKMGMGQREAEFMELVHNGQVVPPTRTLHECGLGDGVQVEIILSHRISGESDKVDVFQAARSGCLVTMRKVCQDRPERVHERDQEGYTPLHHAVKSSRPEAARVLLEAGAEKDSRGYVRARVQVRRARGDCCMHAARQQAAPPCQERWCDCVVGRVAGGRECGQSERAGPIGCGHPSTELRRCQASREGWW